MRIALLSFVFSAAAATAFYHWRPKPMAWHPVGGERIATPAFDISDEAVRRTLKWLSDGPTNHPQDQWLGDICSSTDPPGEIYVAADSGMTNDGTPGRPRRTVVRLGIASEIAHEQFDFSSHTLISRTARPLDEADAERFRTLLVKGRYTQMPPNGAHDRCHHSSSLVTLESCIRGRYYGVARGCRTASDGPSLHKLVAAIEAFAAESPGPADRR